MAQIFSFTSAQTQPSPFYEVAWPGAGWAEPAPEPGSGGDPGVPLSLSGVAIPNLWPCMGLLGKPEPVISSKGSNSSLCFSTHRYF